MFNWGVIAPGRIAHTFAQSLTAVPDGRLYAVASTDPARAKAFAETYSAEKSFGSYEGLVNDPEVDAVYIASPHRFHYEQAVLALQAGKPVLCEKPLAVNLGEGSKLIELARQKNVFLMEALWSRFFPLYGQLRERINAGEIGDIRLIHSTFCFKADRNPQERWLNPELAGGVMLDIGIYNVMLSHFLIGCHPQQVLASGLVGETGVDETVSAILDYGEGVLSTFHASFNVQAENTMRVWGTEGHIQIAPNFWSTTQATITRGDKKVVLNLPFESNGFEYQVMEAQRCIQAGLVESENMSHSDSLETMKVLDRVREILGVRYPFEV